MIQHFILRGEPKGKGRPRFAHGHAYTPDSTREYEDALRLAYVTQNRWAEPHGKDTPLKLIVRCLYGVPKSDSVKVRQAKLCGAKKPTKKPDLSNVLKAVEDALNAVAYADDAQITEIIIKKRYGLNPGVEVELGVDDE